MLYSGGNNRRIRQACILACILSFVFFGFACFYTPGGKATQHQLGFNASPHELIDSRDSTSPRPWHDSPSVSKECLGTMTAGDPRLIEAIRKDFIIYPNRKPLNLVHKDGVDYSQFGQSAIVKELLNSKKNGVFLEMGAEDGESLSNSLYFERYLNWTGVLIEAGKGSFSNLRTKNRRALLVNACVDGGRHPHLRDFYVQKEKALSTLLRPGLKAKSSPRNDVESIWCLPLESILSAANITTVDYFSLDIEGAEMEVLQGIPWDKIQFNVIQIEYNENTRYEHLHKEETRKRRLEELKMFFQFNAPQYKFNRTHRIDVFFVRSM